MEVFLVRHAIAHERNSTRWPDDAQRPLSAAGVAKFRKAARGLGRLLPASAVMLTSPYLRARDTADILARVAKRKKAIECAELAASEPARRAFDLLRSRREKAVVLVGHEPYLSNFLGVALGGNNARLAIEFKKGGAACVEFDGPPKAGRATFKWLLPPRVLRAVR
ncbi:MAG TPA: histidine phosphatase family protein [Steroidobacteraceae bacterium]|nr:histidine phosphatase family protein [Steroidobacteraceae bacterium]